MADPLQELLHGELATLEHDLSRAGHESRLSGTEVRDILSLCQGLHLPGLLTLLALGARTTSQNQQIRPFPLTEETIAEALAHLPVEDEQARQTAQLLSTGQFFGDMADALAAITHVVPGLALGIVRDVRSLPRLPRRLALAIRRDLGDTPATITAVVTDLLNNGSITSPPRMLSHTIRVLYGQATARQLADTIRSLLGNESVRLAVILFARSKGIDISQEDLALVREAINPETPNLGGLVSPGYRHLIRHFGQAQALEILEQFVA